MPTDPATVPPLTASDIATIIRTDQPRYWSNLTNSEVVDQNQSRADCIRAAYALAASRVDTAEVERRAAWGALTAVANELRADHEKGAAQYVEMVRDREYHAPRECVMLPDGRVVEWMTWEKRGGIVGARTLDIVTNYGRPGEESRRCYDSLEHLRVNASLPWADWQAIDKVFAAEVGQ